MKRGQVTLFIILAIVILIMVALISYYFKDISTYKIKDLGLPTEVRLYKENMQNCIESITRDSVVLTSSRGGYYILPEENFEGITAYYYIKGQNIMPDLKKINEEIVKYVDDYLSTCVVSTDTIKSELTNKKIVIKVLEDSVNFEIAPNVKLSFNDKEYEINDNYEIIHTIPLKKVYNIAEQIINTQLQDKENICYSCILQLAEENNVQINIHSLGNSLLFIIENQNYIFNFANQY